MLDAPEAGRQYAVQVKTLMKHSWEDERSIVHTCELAPEAGSCSMQNLDEHLCED